MQRLIATAITQFASSARRPCWVATLLLAFAVQGALAQAPDTARAARWMDDLMWGHGHVGGPFELVDHTGKRRSDAEFRGELMIVYFGYTHCPDICPTDLMQVSLTIDKLGPVGKEVQPLFISLDPERDTTNVLADYVSAFNPRMIGLTGTPEQIRAVADSYKAYYAKYVPADGGAYLIDHTGFIYLMGRSGEYIGFFPPGTSADRMMEIIRQYLSSSQVSPHR